MLRSQIKAQGSFYVCTSCRRQYQQNLAQLRSGGRIRTNPLSSTPRYSSTSSLSVSKLPVLPVSPHITVQSFNGAHSGTGRIHTRSYATWGKFGTNSIPGAWGGSLKNNQAPGIPGLSSAREGSAVGSKIPPATGTTAGMGNMSRGIPPTSSATPIMANQGASNVPTTPLTTPWASTSPSTTIPPSRSSPFSGGVTNAAEIPPARQNPAAFGNRSPAQSIPTAKTTFGQPSTSWNNNMSKPFGRSSGIPRAKPTSSILPAKSTSNISSVNPELLKESSDMDKTNNDITATERPPTTMSTLSTENFKAPNNSFGDQEATGPTFNLGFRKNLSHPAPPGAEFPQLRRRESRTDAFESMSPFTLPPRGTRPPQDLSASPTGGSASDTPRPARGPDFRSRVRDSYHDWGRSPDREASVLPPRRDDRDVVDSAKEMEKLISQTETRKVKIIADDSNDWGLASDNELPRKYDRDMIESASGMRKPEVKTPIGKTAGTPDQFDWANADIDSRRASKSRGLDQRSRLDDPRRGRGRDADRDLEYQSRYETSDRDMDRYGKRDKSKNRPNSRRQSFYEDEDFDSDFDPDFDIEDMRSIKQRRKQKKEEKRAAQEALAPKAIFLPEYITVIDLAEALRVRPKQFIDDLEQLGFENILLDSVMTGETAALVAAEYGFDPTVDNGAEVDLKPRPPPEDLSVVPPRPPIVTIMGHVDHGKTTMLDWLRKSSVAAQEHGGITQHIGAFSVKLRSGKIITFLDTPGHAAFLSMRQRGANVTDIVVLVVAVDDSVKPQTIEALKHAQNSKVPIIVAVNKIDIDPNRLDYVKQDLANHGVEIEDFGGDVQVVAVSGRTGQGMDDLEESILTLSEILDVRAEPDGMVEGWVLESSTKREGKAATILVNRGTLRVGDLIVAGTSYTRVRIMRNEAGTDMKEAPPGTPVEIYGGWTLPPAAGEMVIQAPDETKAQAAVNYRREIMERAEAAAQKTEKELVDREKAEKEALEKMMEEEGEGEGNEDEKVAEPVETGPKLINIIVRGDVMGSVEAVSDSIMEIGNNEVRPRILRSSQGQISESDIDLIAMAKGCIVNFNIPIQGHIRRRAEDAGVKILDHTIIYELVNDVKNELSQQLAPIFTQRVLAEAEVLQVFAINTHRRKLRKNIAGVKVRTGQVTRGGTYRVMRDNENVHQGRLEALKQGKKDVSEMRKGTECGMSLEGFDDIQPGDIIQLYEDVKEKRYL